MSGSSNFIQVKKERKKKKEKKEKINKKENLG